MIARDVGKSFWDNMPHNIRAGLAPLRDIPAKLELHVFPGFEFGKCDPSEVSLWEDSGWQIVSKEMWPKFERDWNADIPMRYGLRLDPSNKLRWGDDYLMRRPKDWGDEHRKREMEYHENRFKAATVGALDESPRSEGVTYEEASQSRFIGRDMMPPNLKEKE